MSFKKWMDTQMVTRLYNEMLSNITQDEIL